MHATEETSIREITEGRKLCVHFLWVRNSKSLRNLPEQIYVADDCTSVSYVTWTKGNSVSEFHHFSNVCVYYNEKSWLQNKHFVI